MKSSQIHKTLTSFFYDLVKAVPAGKINEIILNTIVVDENGAPKEVEFCDKELAVYAASIATQLLEYCTKYSREELDIMGDQYSHTVAHDEKD